jgi:hypothetical protein
MQENLAELIDAAAKVAGSDNKLAKMIDAHQQHISQWRSGKRSCPPADVALMAAIAGYDAEAWALRAMVAKHEGTHKGDMLMRALKKASVAIGAGIATSGASAAPAYLMALNSAVDWMLVLSTTMYKRLTQKLGFA